MQCDDDDLEAILREQYGTAPIDSRFSDDLVARLQAEVSRPTTAFRNEKRKGVRFRLVYKAAIAAGVAAIVVGFWIVRRVNSLPDRSMAGLDPTQATSTNPDVKMDSFKERDESVKSESLHGLGDDVAYSVGVEKFSVVNEKTESLVPPADADRLRAAIKLLRAKYLLKSAPGKLSRMSDVRSLLQRAGGPKELDVVLRGKICAGKDDVPWSACKAAFVLAEFLARDGESDHDPYARPEHTSKIDEYRAFVSFDSEQGLAHEDVREIFGVQDQQDVLVKGRATLGAAGKLLIKGSGIYIEQ
ncbi:MAG TPA: hypothetical protein DDW52_09070 [Planctomycetaceae bacterium]|nr:hypothetical protein [Planctomycetaceae bacterium]